MSEQFFEAIQSGDRSKVEADVVRDPGLLQARSAAGLSPVLTAFYYNKPEIAELLIGRGAPLDLFEACTAGRLERVQELVEADSSLVNAVAPDGFGPLGLACFFGREAVAHYLLANGASPNQPSHNAQGVTPLHSAVAAGNLEIVLDLVAHGIDPDARQSGGFTPLHAAAQNGDLAIAELLLAAGADPALATDDGRTALDFAHESGSAAIKELLSDSFSLGEDG